VAVLDRHAPQKASTSASTALLQWEIDTPMLGLEDRLGFETVAAIYRRSVESVREIGALVGANAAQCRFDWRDTLYLSGNELDPADLREEHRSGALALMPPWRLWLEDNERPANVSRHAPSPGLHPAAHPAVGHRAGVLPAGCQ
jgi:hypothetical protein